MGLAARQLKAVEHMEQPTVLEVRVQHIQGDVSDIKVALGKLDEKIDGKIDAVRAELGELRKEVGREIGNVRTELGNLRAEIAVSALSLTRWMIGTLFTAVSLSAAVAFGVARLLR